MTRIHPAQRRIHKAAIRLFVKKGSTQLNVTELAEEAGVARGTIYSNMKTMEQLFERVASQICLDMHQSVYASFVGIEDPAERLANAVRFFVRRTHEEPQWGIFLSRFALKEVSLQDVFHRQATADVLSGLSAGRYRFTERHLGSVISMIASTTLGAMLLVLEGVKTWRDAGSESAELILRALGVSGEEAHQIAITELPVLPAPD